MTDGDLEALAVARREILEAIGRYADGWPSTEGGIVTAFVVLAEVATPAGGKALVETSGTGHDANEGIQTWLRRGILHYALYAPRED